VGGIHRMTVVLGSNRLKPDAKKGPVQMHGENALSARETMTMPL
jgi:hypothetical protein